ncbi:hypothetical protein ACJX0J_039499 [Zea mays]
MFINNSSSFHFVAIGSETEMTYHFFSSVEIDPHLEEQLETVFIFVLMMNLKSCLLCYAGVKKRLGFNPAAATWILHGFSLDWRLLVESCVLSFGICCAMINQSGASGVVLFLRNQVFGATFMYMMPNNTCA